jgi:hypothetical protein
MEKRSADAATIRVFAVLDPLRVGGPDRCMV